MREIFVSYRREDSSDAAGRLCDELTEQFGKDAVFRDVVALAPGSDFPETIRATLPDAKVVLVVIGKRWLSILRRRADDPSDLLVTEIETALAHRDRILVIPVLVQRVTMPKSSQLPPPLQPLCTLNAVELDDEPRWESDLRRLVTAIEPRVPRLPSAPALAETTILLAPTTADLLMMFVSNQGGAPWTPPSSMAPAAEVASGDFYCCNVFTHVAAEALTSAGDTGPRTATLAVDYVQASATALALRPAASSSPPSTTTTVAPTTTTTIAPPATTTTLATTTTTTTTPPPSGGPIVLSDVTASYGLVQPLVGMYGHATAFGDVNDDGWQDLFVGTFTDYPSGNYLVRGATGPSPDRLLLGGPGGFTPDDTFPAMFGRTSGATFADLDNDADLDLVITRHVATGRPNADTPNAVLRNDGGRFAVVQALAPGHQGRGIGVVDYDGDGLLDLFVADDAYDGGTSLLLKNDGALQFRDVTAATGLTGIQGFGVAVADLNDDGWSDLVVAGNAPTGGPGSSPTARLFVNTRSGRFSELDNRAFAAPTYYNEDFTTGAAVADLNRDGRPDIVIGHHYASTLASGTVAPIRVYLHTGLDEGGRPTFRDATSAAEIPSFPTKSSHVEIVDFDNDGWPDILTTASAADGTRPTVLRSLGVVQGALRFAAPEGIGNRQYWVTGATADVDHDGRVDVFLTDFDPNRPSLLFRTTRRRGTGST